ncbi:MAG: DUF998 domain-containing protein [Candidatus Anstonellaceae archaeon]
MERQDLLRLAGICGIISPVVAFVFIILAVGNYPSFDWYSNDLSDIGGASGMAALLFNASLVFSSALSLVFTYGLWDFMPDYKLSKVGVALFALSLVTLAGSGVFNKNFEPLHTQIALSFFFLFPLAMLFICGAFLQARNSHLGTTTMMMFLLAVLAWGLHWTGTIGKGLALPELISSLALSFWGIAVSIEMLGPKGQKGK